MSFIPSIVPTLFNAGTTVNFSRSFNDYPASGGWTYKIFLAGANTLNKAGTTEGDGFVVTLSATETAALAPGAYKYVERVTDGTSVYEVGSGVISVGVDLSAATDGSTLTHEEKVLAILDAAIEGRLTGDMEHYQLGGVAVSKIPAEKLVQLRGTYAGKVWRQRNPGRIGPSVSVEMPDRPFRTFGSLPWDI